MNETSLGMQSDAPLHSTPAPDKGLPPVAPPDARFLAKLFVVPLLIVSCLVGLCMLVIWWRARSLSPEAYLEKLDSSNWDVRWRGAEDLAQVLLRDDHLAANPKFSLDIADRLRQAYQAVQQLDRQRPTVAAKVESTADEPTPELKYLQFLTSCQGSFIVPVGVPLLNEMAEKADGSDAMAVYLRRYFAIWALARAGENFRRFDKLPAEQQVVVLAELEQEVGTSGSDRRAWARTALENLKDRQAGRPRALGVDRALAHCAEDKNPVLREITAFALISWEGDAAETARIEQTLLKLSFDDGRGDDLRAQLPARNRPEPEQRSRERGSACRYNATMALALRGSEKIKERLGILQQMLDEPFQTANFRLEWKDGREEANEPMARNTVTNALKAAATLHEKQPALDLSSLDEAVDKLTQSSDAAVKAEAKRTQEALSKTH